MLTQQLELQWVFNSSQLDLKKTKVAQSSLIIGNNNSHFIKNKMIIKSTIFVKEVCSCIAYNNKWFKHTNSWDNIMGRVY